MATRAWSPDGRRWCGRTLGLAVESDFPLPGLRPDRSVEGSRRLQLRRVPLDELESDWRRREAVRVWEARRGARIRSTVDRHDELGYRVYAYRFGRYILSKDGREARGALPQVAAWRVPRLLFAAIMPMAAAIQGLSVFHASAVARGGRAVAFFADSGVGKSSLAAHMVLRGATYVTDDRLVLEPEGQTLWAHPGPAVARVEPVVTRALAPGDRDRLGEVIGRDDSKVNLSIRIPGRRLPLAGVYLLERERRVTKVVIDEVPKPDPRELLASAHPGVEAVVTQRLLAQLDACAALASGTPVFRVSAPSSGGPAQLAESIEAHADDTL